MKCLLSLCAFLWIGFAAKAQLVADPTTWTYEAKKVSANEYELIFHVVLTDGWHIFSQQPGDEFLIPPSFTFKDKVKQIGKVQENGKLMTEKMEGIDNLVRFYEHKVDFVQKVQVDGPGKITGEHEYQVCNDKMCLPPKTMSFVFELK